MEGLESGVFSWVGGHSPLSPLCVVVGCFRVLLRVWELSGTCSLQDLIDGVGVLEQPSCKKPAYWLAGEAEANGRRAPGNLESGVS